VSGGLKLPEGFSREWTGRDCACIGVFGPQGSGKTRLCATACAWSAERGKVPGWLVMDRKTRKTVRDTCAALGYDLPVINRDDFITQAEALKLATNEADEVKKKTYTVAVEKVFKAAVDLAANPVIDPIVIDSASGLWDWIAYSHFGKKQDVGKSRVWGPPKQDWTDLLDGIAHKTVIVTLHAKDQWKDDKSTGKLTFDGPPHLGYTVTSLVRLRQFDGKLASDQTYVDRFRLDLIESQDNKALEGQEDLLSGESVTFADLMSVLRPEE
jgi:hypothetical protein